MTKKEDKPRNVSEATLIGRAYVKGVQLKAKLKKMVQRSRNLSRAVEKELAVAKAEHDKLTGTTQDDAAPVEHTDPITEGIDDEEAT